MGCFTTAFEAERLQTLHDYAILDTPAEPSIDDLTRLASEVAQTPIALVSLIAKDRQWFKSRVGVEVTQTPLDLSFCVHALMHDDVMIVPDTTADPRFASNPLVTGEYHVRFYAGMPLKTANGHVLGTLCVLDTQPRHLSSQQINALRRLGRQVVDQLELRRTRRKLKATEASRQVQFERDRAAAREYADRVAIQMEHDALHDSLTGLPNRTLFTQRVERCLARSHRVDQHSAVLVLDLDRFKNVNDSLGHAAGDLMLTTIAARISTALSQSDDEEARHGWPRHGMKTLARFGGDEFTLLLEDLTSPVDAEAIAMRILASVRKPIDFEGHELTTSVSIGVVTFGAERQYNNAKDLIRDADAAMYRAKASGKDRMMVFDQAMHEAVLARMNLEADLRRCIQRRELEVHYQPIVSLTNNTPRTVGFEALVRWRRKGKLVSPGEFIPVAEDTGLIISIGEWVLCEACQQLATWRERGGAASDLYVTVNVSRRQLCEEGFPEFVQGVLDTTGLPSSSLGLEITESAVMTDPAAAEATLRSLKENAGVRIFMDDFGTGYSSLAGLTQLPIDVLKIDRSFILNVGSNPREAALMETIVLLAHRLEMVVVAEGIETAQQASFLLEAGCDYAQGFHFSRPLPADAAETHLFGVPLAIAG